MGWRRGHRCPQPRPPFCLAPALGKAAAGANNDATAAAAASATVGGKVDSAGQEKNNFICNHGDYNEDEDKWGRGTLFNLSSSLSSSIVGHLISNAIPAAGLLLSGILVPRIDVKHCNSLSPRRRRTSSRLTKR
jgi:hypothetical protein